MKTPTKVVIEVTGEAYTTRVFAGEQVIASLTSHMINAYSSKGSKENEATLASFTKEDEDLAEALREGQAAGFAIASELHLHIVKE